MTVAADRRGFVLKLPDGTCALWRPDEPVEVWIVGERPPSHTPNDAAYSDVAQAEVSTGSPEIAGGWRWKSQPQVTASGLRRR